MIMLKPNPNIVKDASQRPDANDTLVKELQPNDVLKQPIRYSNDEIRDVTKVPTSGTPVEDP